VENIIILSLATFRIASLLVNEEGPFGIFVRLRGAVGVTLNQYHQEEATTIWGELFTCIWCMSVWAGCGWTLVYFIFPTIAIWLALPFALSAAAIFINRWAA
jgi:hypothetical protein